MAFPERGKVLGFFQASECPCKLAPPPHVQSHLWEQSREDTSNGSEDEGEGVLWVPENLGAMPLVRRNDGGRWGKLPLKMTTFCSVLLQLPCHNLCNGIGAELTGLLPTILYVLYSSFLLCFCSETLLGRLGPNGPKHKCPSPKFLPHCYRHLQHTNEAWRNCWNRGMNLSIFNSLTKWSPN